MEEEYYTQKFLDHDVQNIVNEFNKIKDSPSERILFLKTYIQGIIFNKILNYSEFFQQLNNQDNPQFIEDLLDVIWIYGNSLQNVKLLNSQQPISQYNNLLQTIQTLKLIPVQDLLEYFDEEQEYQSGLLEKSSYIKKRRRINTKRYFEQQKFNLLREENEGYSKMLVEVMEAKNFNDTPENNQIIYSNIISLIGYFDLDPDRVLYIIMEAFQRNPDKMGYLTLLRNFRAQNIYLLLGDNLNKINDKNKNDINKTVYTKNIDQTLKENKRIPDRKLMITIAYLLKYQFFKLDDIWGYLKPNDQEMLSSLKQRFELAKFFFEDTFIARMTDLDSKEQEQRIKNKNILKGQFLYNQKLWMLYALVYSNNWEQFEIVYSTLQHYIDIKSHEPLLNQLSDILNWSLEKVYRQFSPSRFFKNPKLNIRQFLYDPQCSFKQIQQLEKIDEQFFEQLYTILKVLKSYVGNDTYSYCKLTRIFTQIYNNNMMLSEDEHLRYSEYVKQICCEYLLPGISMFKSNASVVSEFWNLFNNFHYKVRYQAYFDWFTVYQYKNPHLLRKIGKKYLKIKGIFNKIHGGSKKFHSRMIGKLSHNFPIIIFQYITTFLTKEGYDNHIPVAINSLNYCSNLSLDLFGFLIIRFIQDCNMKPLIIELAQTNTWVKNCALLIGTFYKKFFNVDYLPIFVHLIETFKQSNNSLDLNKQLANLTILNEFITLMTGQQLPDDLSEDQLECLAGGPWLYFDSLALTGDIRTSKKNSIPSLENFFWKITKQFGKIKISDTSEPITISLAYYLLVLISQMKSRFLEEYQFDDLKCTGQFMDQINSSITHFLRFLSFQSDTYINYSELLPQNALQQLIIDFKIPFELSFHITRNSFKNLSKMNEEERIQFFNQLKEQQDMIEPSKIFQSSLINHSDPLLMTPQGIDKKSKQMWNYISPELYATFWMQTLDNLYIPRTQYEKHIQKLTNLIQQKKESKEKDKDKELEKNKTLLERLKSEYEKYKKRREAQEIYMASIKETLLMRTSEEYFREFVPCFVQTCLLPRMLLEPKEAIYCAKFVINIFKVKGININSILRQIYEIIQNVIPYLQCATEQEARYISIFLLEIFKIYQHWNDEKKLQETLKNIFDVENFEKFNYERYRSFILVKIFEKFMLYLKLLKEHPMQILNIIAVLNKLIYIFPPIKEIGEGILQHLDDVTDQFKSEDIKVRKSAYTNFLKNQMKNLPDIDLQALKNQGSKPNDSKNIIKQVRKEIVKKTDNGTKQKKKKSTSPKVKKSRSPLKKSRSRKKSSSRGKDRKASSRGSRSGSQKKTRRSRSNYKQSSPMSRTKQSKRSKSKNNKSSSRHSKSKSRSRSIKKERKSIFTEKSHKSRSRSYHKLKK